MAGSGATEDEGAAGVGDVPVGVAKFVEGALVAVSDAGTDLETFA